jgi:N-acetylglucosamine kinase-like BadF-type ATPase/DNA-binding Xre family transcriptional regulator
MSKDKEFLTSKKVSKNIARNISKLLEDKANNMSSKELAEKSGINYSTLAPILRGERDFRVSNLISLADALKVSPNDLLSGLFNEHATALSRSIKNATQPDFFVSFITDVGLTHYRIIDNNTGKIESNVCPFSLYCTTDPNLFFEQIDNSIYQIYDEINLQNVAIYVSVLAYEHVVGRNKIENILSKKFGSYILEPDWEPSHKTLLSHKNGILITVNDGYAISYSIDNCKTINKIQGYSFPISDEAGNFWLGCEAIKHAIKVKEGIDNRSMLSDKILSLVNSDLNLLATMAYDHQREFFVEVAGLVKELANKKDKAYQLIKTSFNNIWEHVKRIDLEIGQELPVCISGGLAYLYEEFIPKKRLISVDFENIINDELNLSISMLQSRFGNNKESQ